MKVPAAAIHFPEEDRGWILARIGECLESGRLTLGPNGAAFEEAFAQLCQVRYAVAVNSGTSALEIILRTIGVEDREVVVPTNTFYATAGAVLHAGGRIRFADCEPESFALDVESLRAALGPQTAAVVLVHIGGIITPRIDEIRAHVRRGRRATRGGRRPRPRLSAQWQIGRQFRESGCLLVLSHEGHDQR